MRQYTSEKYIQLVENTKNPVLRKFMDSEIEVIRKVNNPSEKTFIDLGAGYGRVLPVLQQIARNAISIEINPKMLSELRRRSAKAGNSTVIEGNIENLSKLLKGHDVKNPVLLLLQNTLGTIEGNWRKVLFEMRKVAKEHDGEIIISFFRQEAFESYGISMFREIKEMVGEPDLLKTNFFEGLFVSKTGYTARWRNKQEIKEIIEYFFGTIVNEISQNEFLVLHIKF